MHIGPCISVRCISDPLDIRTRLPNLRCEMGLALKGRSSAAMGLGPSICAMGVFSESPARAIQRSDGSWPIDLRQGYFQKALQGRNSSTRHVSSVHVLPT